MELEGTFGQAAFDGVKETKMPPEGANAEVLLKYYNDIVEIPVEGERIADLDKIKAQLAEAKNDPKKYAELLARIARRRQELAKGIQGHAKGIQEEATK